MIRRDVTDVRSLLRNVSNDIKEECAKAFKRYGRYGLQVALNTDFRNPNNNEVVSLTGRLGHQRIINTRTIPTNITGNIADHFDEWVDTIQQGQSGMSIERINHIDLEFIKAPQIRGRGFIETNFKNRSVLNIHNTDDDCILYCIDAAFHPVDSKSHPQRPNKYNTFLYNTGNLAFPISVDEITMLEKLNDNSFACNVFAYDVTKEDGEISVIRMAKDHYERIKQSEDKSY